MKWVTPIDRFPLGMNSSIHRLLIAALLFVQAASAFPAEGPQSLEEQLALFLEWFPGRFDSSLQTRTDVLDEVPGDERNYHRHSIFRRVSLPAFGEVVFYAEQYRDGDPEKVYRQRIYVFTLDEDRGAIRLRVHVPESVEPLRGAYRDPSLLSGLTPEATTVWEGCDLWWQWKGDHFRGALDPGACRFTSEAFGQEIVLDEYLLLDGEAIQFADRGLALDGSYLFGMRGQVPNISRKVRPFRCELREGDGTILRWTHDQGGRLEAGGRVLDLQRWNAPGHERGLRLTLSSEMGDGLAVAIAAKDATIIGMMHGDLEAVCRHDPGAVYDDR